MIAAMLVRVGRGSKSALKTRDALGLSDFRGARLFASQQLKLADIFTLSLPSGNPAVKNDAARVGQPTLVFVRPLGERQLNEIRERARKLEVRLTLRLCLR